MEIPAVVVALLGPGLPAGGWFVGRLIERRWQHADRRLGFVEANRAEQLRLLRELNGDLYQKWLWLADHPDAAAWLDLQRANRQLKEDIERALEAEGLVTFHSLLRSALPKCTS